MCCLFLFIQQFSNLLKIILILQQFLLPFNTINTLFIFLTFHNQYTRSIVKEENNNSELPSYPIHLMSSLTKILLMLHDVPPTSSYVLCVIKINISWSPSNNPFEWIAFFSFIYRSMERQNVVSKNIEKKKSKQWKKGKKCSIGKIFAQLFLWPLTKLSTYNNITPKAHWANLKHNFKWLKACSLSFTLGLLLNFQSFY